MKTNEIYMGDPFIYTHENNYYLIGTTHEMEGFRVYKSGDLENWTEAGWILRKNDTGFGSRCFWAPEIFIHQGKFYLTYSAFVESTQKLQMALAVSESPTGPFHNLYAPWFTNDKGTIDGHIFKDDDGALYLYFSMNWFDPKTGINNGENYVSKLKKDLSGLDGEIRFVSRAEMDWETPMPNNRCNEGPTVIKHGNDYYMTYSANDTASDKYGIGYLKSKHPAAGWKKVSIEPWLTTTDNLFSPGHNSIFKDLHGNLKIVFHSLAQRDKFERIVNIRNLAIENGRLSII